MSSWHFLRRLMVVEAACVICALAIVEWYPSGFVSLICCEAVTVTIAFLLLGAASEMASSCIECSIQVLVIMIAIISSVVAGVSPVPPNNTSGLFVLQVRPAHRILSTQPS
jgi:hypothetical protein